MVDRMDLGETDWKENEKLPELMVADESLIWG